MYAHIVYRRLGVSPRDIAYCRTTYVPPTRNTVLPASHALAPTRHGRWGRVPENASSRKTHPHGTPDRRTTELLIRRCVMQIAIMKEDQSRRGALCRDVNSHRDCCYLSQYKGITETQMWIKSRTSDFYRALYFVLVIAVKINGEGINKRCCFPAATRSCNRIKKIFNVSA